MDFIKLSGKKEEACRQARSDTQMQSMAKTGALFVKAMREGNEEEQKNIRQGLKKLERETWYDLDQFDIGMLLKKSLRGWSFTEKLSDDPYDQLNAKTSMWAAEQAVDLLRPVTKADLKNSASVSTLP